MMAGATLQQQLQQQQGTTVAPSAEDEALKRNTDCVYFLTSPLACKKGAECEYRHSEYARVNPRDCYFWLNGNCLNPKCSFRHPPLDGLFGTETEAHVPSMRATTVAVIHAPQNPVKAPVQCFYFQKGYCTRGDKCGFLHRPDPTYTKSSQQIVPPPSTELPPTKPLTSHQNVPPEVKAKQTNFAKAEEAPIETKPAPKLETGPRRNGIVRPSKSLHDEAPKYKATNLPSVVNGNLSRYNHMHQLQVPDGNGSLNGKDTDEFLRESSPGFDVLVDDELRNSEFYHGEDHYGNTGHFVDYSSVGDMDRETYRDYENSREQYGWEQPHRESRGYPNVDSDDVDLRYRLWKHRRGNGLRSVVSPDFACEDRARENSISSRLGGRIRLPRSPRGSVEREREGGRRLRDRIKARVAEDYRGPRRRREMEDNFAGPRSLAELKGREQQSQRKRKQMEDNNCSFKGPMPLSEILKRKRGCEGSKQREVAEVPESERGNVDEHEGDEGEYYEAENEEEDDDFAKKIGVLLS